MSCIIPRRIINPKYKKFCKVFDFNRYDSYIQIGVKNLRIDLSNGIPLHESSWNTFASYIFTDDIYTYSDREDFFLDVPCGKCINCLRSRFTMWRTRLLYEFYYMSSDQRANSYFVTLTIKPEYYPAIRADPAKYIRRFLDRIRKKVGTSVRHFIITEFGDQTQRLHFHGLFFDIQFDINTLEDYWSYGFVAWSQLNETRIGYAVGYVSKGNDDLVVKKTFTPKIFATPGLGKAYCDDDYNISFHHKEGEPVPILINESGYPIAMPRYYREKIFTDEELERLQIAYFANLSDDVIPDPPYRIGNIIYDDYTLYLQAIKPILELYNEEYKKKNSTTLKDINYEL